MQLSPNALKKPKPPATVIVEQSCGLLVAVFGVFDGVFGVINRLVKDGYEDRGFCGGEFERSFHGGFGNARRYPSLGGLLG